MMNDPKSRIDEIHRRLIREYGERRPEARKPPLDELIFTILSQHTNDANRDRAWERLKGDHESWATIAALSDREIESRIRVGGLAAQKARRISAILQTVRKEHGSFDLDFLQDLDVEEIRDYLLGFPGVGPKTVACVLIFSLDKPAFPVDTHIHRLAIRLGLMPRKTSAGKAHRILGSLVPTNMYLTLHLNLISHGRKVCKAISPLCHQCVISDICPKIL
jgi:endonuclease-3